MIDELSFDIIEKGVSMEDNSISLNATKILNKTFKPNGNGYDPDEVDEFLDKIIMDYRAFEKYYLESKKYIVELETNWRKEKEKISTLEVENARMKERLSGIKDSSAVNSTNIDLLNRITKLENELYKRGVNPNNI